MYYLAISEKTQRVNLFESSDGFKPHKGSQVPKRISKLLSDDSREKFRVLDVYPEGSLNADLMDGIQAFDRAADPAPGTTGVWQLFTGLIAEITEVVRASATKRAKKLPKSTRRV